MSKKKKKNNKETKTQEYKGIEKKSNRSLRLAIIAIAISALQLFFTIPAVLKYFSRVEIYAAQLGISKHPDEDFIRHSFLIRNSGTNTAKNVELHLGILKGDKVRFIPEIFELVRSDIGR